VSRVVAGEATELPKPELEEPAEMVRFMIEPISSLTPPPGLRTFMDRWAFDNAGLEDLSSRWGGALFMHGGSLGGMFTAFGDEDEQRASFASEVEYLSTFPTPSKRGQMLLRTLFCVDTGVPVDHPMLELPVPGKTRRQAIEEATQSPSCVGCHVYLGSLGFSLENFDDVGDYRETDNGLPVDASGSANLTYESFEYGSFADLAPQLAASPEVAACVTRSLFDYALQAGIPEGARVPTRGELDYALCEFDRNRYSGQKLLETIVETPSFMLE
jgi:hypothetical protein